MSQAKTYSLSIKHILTCGPIEKIFLLVVHSKKYSYLWFGFAQDAIALCTRLERDARFSVFSADVSSEAHTLQSLVRMSQAKRLVLKTFNACLKRDGRFVEISPDVSSDMRCSVHFQRMSQARRSLREICCGCLKRNAESFKASAAVSSGTVSSRNLH